MLNAEESHSSASTTASTEKINNFEKKTNVLHQSEPS